MSQYLSHLAALTLNRVETVQPRLASRFETPVDRPSPGNNGLEATKESRVAPSAHLQSSTVTATDSPVARKVVTSSADLQAKQESRGQDQPKVVEHNDFRLKKSGSPGEQQKPSSDRGFSPVDTEQTSHAAQSVSEPVAQVFYAIHKDTLPKESIHTLVERVQEHFTETTHSEFVIREMAVVSPDVNQKTGRYEESPRPAPVKPTSIVVRSEQSTIGSKTPSQVSAEQMSSAQSSQKIRKLEESPQPAPVKPSSIVVRSEQFAVGAATRGQFGAQSVPSTQFGTDATPAPTIQVTIGRIEVRATQVADKPAAKSRVARNTMSLDDYLNRRNGGKS